MTCVDSSQTSSWGVKRCEDPRNNKRGGPMGRLFCMTDRSVFLLFFEICLQQLLLHITRNRLIVSEVHSECRAS